MRLILKAVYYVCVCPDKLCRSIYCPKSVGGGGGLRDMKEMSPFIIIIIMRHCHY